MLSDEDKQRVEAIRMLRFSGRTIGGSNADFLLSLIDKYEGVVGKLPLDLSDPQRPVIMTDKWGRVDLFDYVIVYRRDWDKMCASLDELQEAFATAEPKESL